MTETTASSKRSKSKPSASTQGNQCRCLLRRCLVEATPEELVRQAVVSRLIHVLGYPPSLIVIEKKLSELPLGVARKLPNRRLDLLVYSPDMRPVLLVECKASRVTEAALRQVLGYNRFVRSVGVAVVGSQSEVCLLGNKIVQGLPSWAQLVDFLGSPKQ